MITASVDGLYSCRPFAVLPFFLVKQMFVQTLEVAFQHALAMQGIAHL
jgi:predicted lipid carrier protein YhbT